MTNEDLKRFYENNGDADIANDFVRYDADGRIQAVSPDANHDVATKAYVDNAVAAAQSGETADYAHVHDFTELAAATPVATVDNGIELHYDNDGKILIPIEGSDDIVVDIDEQNKAIAIHLDTSVVNKLHEHANKTVLDSFTARDKANIDNAIQLASIATAQLSAMDLHDLQLVETDGYFDSAETMPQDKHIHVLFELETAGTHAGADFVLHPYNSSVCNVCFTLLVGGEYVNGFACIDETNKVHISFANVTTSITNVIAHYRVL